MRLEKAIAEGRVEHRKRVKKFYRKSVIRKLEIRREFNTNTSTEHTRV
jgi:hypothetical protein